MTSEGNQVDTGIRKEAEDLVRCGKAGSIPEAIEILLKEAKSSGNNVRLQKIKTTEKGLLIRRSRKKKDKKRR